MQILSGGAHCHFAVSNSTQRTEPVGKFMDRSGFALDDDDLETVVMIHVNMGGGDDLVVIIMLNLGHFFLEFGLMMIIDIRGKDLLLRRHTINKCL